MRAEPQKGRMRSTMSGKLAAHWKAWLAAMDHPITSFNWWIPNFSVSNLNCARTLSSNVTCVPSASPPSKTMITTSVSKQRRKQMQSIGIYRWNKPKVLACREGLKSYVRAGMDFPHKKAQMRIYINYFKSVA